MSFSRKHLALLAAAATTLLGGCANGIVTSQVEKRIEAKLPELIGPAKDYKVEVAGGTGKMLKGKMREIRIYGKGVNVTSNLKVDDLLVSMKDVEFDTDSQSIKSCGSTSFQAEVTQDTLNNYLKTQRPDLNELKIVLKPDKMLVHLRPKLLGLSVGADVEGNLKVTDATKLYYKVDRLALAGLHMPSAVADYVEEKINPIQDLSTAGVKLTVDNVDIDTGKVVMTGSANVLSGSTSSR